MYRVTGCHISVMVWLSEARRLSRRFVARDEVGRGGPARPSFCLKFRHLQKERGYIRGVAFPFCVDFEQRVGGLRRKRVSGEAYGDEIGGFVEDGFVLEVPFLRNPFLEPGPGVLHEIPALEQYIGVGVSLWVIGKACGRFAIEKPGSASVEKREGLGNGADTAEPSHADCHFQGGRK